MCSQFIICILPKRSLGVQLGKAVRPSVCPCIGIPSSTTLDNFSRFLLNMVTTTPGMNPRASYISLRMRMIFSPFLLQKGVCPSKFENPSIFSNKKVMLYAGSGVSLRSRLAPLFAIALIIYPVPNMYLPYIVCITTRR